MSTPSLLLSFFFFFNDTATTEIYTLSLHDALPICRSKNFRVRYDHVGRVDNSTGRSEEHTSELQSHLNLVCRLLLEKKKKTQQAAATQVSRCNWSERRSRSWI